MATKKRQVESTQRRRVPHVFIQPPPMLQAPRVEQGHELINPKYNTEGFNKLLYYLATERAIILCDPVKPKTSLDDELFPAFPVLFGDRWRSQWPDASLRVELLKLQARNATVRFKDLLTIEEQKIVYAVVNDEMSRRGVTAEDLYHRSGVPTPCQEFPLDLFARRGFPITELWGQQHPMEETRIKPRPCRKKAPERIEVVRAWQPFDFLPREILQGSNGTHVTLKGCAFCQLIRRALGLTEANNQSEDTYDEARFARQVDWFSRPIRDYFHVPLEGTLRWYSWIAQPLFYLLQAGDDWTWKRFKALVDFLGWRRAEADFFRSWVTLPDANEEYQSVKRGLLTEARGTARKGLRDWFHRLEEQFVAGIQGFGEKALRLHWLTKDSQFVIPYLLLQIYRKSDLKRYQKRVQIYLQNLKPLLQKTSPLKPERFAYQVWEFETMSQHDPWYSVCLNWEFWVGSEDLLRAIFTPLKKTGRPKKIEAKQLITPCLPRFHRLRSLGVRRSRKSGMQICNALIGQEIYPKGADAIFDSDLRRSINNQAK